MEKKSVATRRLHQPHVHDYTQFWRRFPRLKANWQRAAKMSVACARRCSIRCPRRRAPCGDSELLRQLQEIPAAARLNFITEFLQREVQGFLRLAQPPASTNRFLDLGTDFADGR